MAVAFYGEFNGAVSQLLTNISNGGTIGQKEACIGMTKVMETTAAQSCLLHTLEEMVIPLALFTAFIGRVGGSKTSPTKKRSSQLNGLKGGHPEGQTLTQVAILGLKDAINIPQTLTTTTLRGGCNDFPEFITPTL